MKRFEPGEALKILAMGCAVSATAGGSGDNTELTGEVIDCLGFSGCVVAIPFKAVLAAGESLALTVKVAESDDGSSFGTDETIASAVSVASSSGGGTIADCYKLAVNLAGVGTPRKRYLRFKLTPNLSASSSDSCVLSAAVILGGPDKAPVSAWAIATA